MPTSEQRERAQDIAKDVVVAWVTRLPESITARLDIGQTIGKVYQQVCEAVLKTFKQQPDNPT